MTSYCLTMKKAAEYIGLSYDTIVTLKHNGVLTAYRPMGIGKKKPVMFLVKDLENFIKSKKDESIKNCTRETL